MTSKPLESDWKSFRKMAPKLRDRYLDQCNSELSCIINDDSSTSTENFWTLEERVRKEARILRECLDGHSRSRMLEFILIMYRHKMLTDSDLREFSEELKARVNGILSIQ
ncbi:multidrug transporter [Verrucomicrobiaceae bacterium N1E253]|uniref:Multidrug transporter n=1 Tax=Oceaniferula marina TaxID=2748318 RepID=A0A851GJM7_9BACT|nr:multidrug transporter [Oceaniferula marina]NWK57723.1 multidrug transporter [Oceaniferula marina]